MKRLFLVFVVSLLYLSSFGQKYYTKAEMAALLGAKSDVANIINSSWYTDAEVDALVSAVPKSIFTRTYSAVALNTTVDQTDYFFGVYTTVTLETWSGKYDELPFNCKVIGCAISTRSDNAASTETYTVYIRKNNTSDYALCTVVANGAAYSTFTYSTNNLNNSYAAEDRVEIKVHTPTWVTNPTNWMIEVTVYFQLL